MKNECRENLNEPDPSQTLLSVRGLQVLFRGEERLARAVDGVDFSVGRGEVVCLVGESGCGKTVSALSVMGLLPRTADILAGEIRFKGRNLAELDTKAFEKLRGKEISMIFQEPMTSLNPVFTIGDQIEEAIMIHESVTRAQARQRAADLLADVEIPSPGQRLDDYPHQLSGGQRQRVMIAMALACDPDLIIADEPTTALDVTVQFQILQLFRKIRTRRQLSLLFITHNLGVVAQIADRVYVMYAGLIVESGSVEQIFTDPLHPYTIGLLAALPSREKKGKPLYSIHGSVPDPAFKPPGCPFNPRCTYVQDSCREQLPPLCDFGEGHCARCPVTFALQRNGDLPEPRQRLNPPADLPERLKKT